MIIVLTASYVALLFILEKIGLIRFDLFWKISPVIVFLALNVALFIPMGWGAPTGPALVVRHSVQIVPNVTGEVIDVPVQPNTPIKANEVLFRIDPVPYESQVQALEAQLKFQELRLAQATQLQDRGTGRTFDVEERQAEVNRLRAQLEGAKWNLESTVVRAPADGVVTNLALRKGARVGTAPVMAFIDTSETRIFVEIPQINSRYVAVGQNVEVAFKVTPGRVVTGKIADILPAIAAGQAQPTGLAVVPAKIETLPFVLRVVLDDSAFASALPAGAAGDAAIFTDRVRVTHVIRKIILRQVAILNYVIPF